MENLWRSRWKTVLKLPLSDAKPVSSSLPFTSQAARIKYGAPAGKTADAAFLWSTLNPSFLACFFFFLLSFFVSSKPVTFLFLRILPIFSLLCTTWNFAKFHTFLSVFLSLHSCCPLIRSDEALWRNVIFTTSMKCKKRRRKEMTRTWGIIWVWDGFSKQLSPVECHMTDISVIKMIISVAVWRIYPSWVNDKLWAREGLGHSGMFWARLSGDNFRSKLEIISFISRVMLISKSFFCFPRFCKIWRQTFEPCGFWFRRCLGALFENCAPSLGIFLRIPTTATSILKIVFLFSKQSWCYLPDSCGDPQAEQSSLVVVRRKLEWKRIFRALARSGAEEPPIVVAFSTSRLRWSMVQKRQKPDEFEVRRQWLPFIVYKPARKPASFEEPHPRPDVSSVLLFAVFLYVAVQ